MSWPDCPADPKITPEWPGPTHAPLSYQLSNDSFMISTAYQLRRSTPQDLWWLIKKSLLPCCGQILWENSVFSRFCVFGGRQPVDERKRMPVGSAYRACCGVSFDVLRVGHKSAKSHNFWRKLKTSGRGFPLSWSWRNLKRLHHRKRLEFIQK